MILSIDHLSRNIQGLLKIRGRGMNEEITFTSTRANAYTVNDDNLSEGYILTSIFHSKVVTFFTQTAPKVIKKIELALK